MPTRRLAILDEIASRLASIPGEPALYWGPVVLTPDDPLEALAIAVGATETTSGATDRKVIVLPVEVHIYTYEVKATPGTFNNGWQRAEELLGLVKAAIESDDERLDGLADSIEAGEVSPLPREEGSAHLGIRVEYRITYAELWGAP